MQSIYGQGFQQMTWSQPQSQPQPIAITITPVDQSTYDILFGLRIIFYLLVLIKLIEIVLHRKPKLSIRERIYRKFIFSHGEVIKLMNQQQKQDAEKTLKNTLQNANLPPLNLQKRRSKQNKKIVFLTQQNKYHDPKNYQNLEKMNESKNKGTNQAIQTKEIQQNQEKLQKAFEYQSQEKDIKDPQDKIQKQVQQDYVEKIVHEIDRSDFQGHHQTLIEAMQKVKHQQQDQDPQQMGLLQGQGQQNQQEKNNYQHK